MPYVEFREIWAIFVRRAKQTRLNWSCRCAAPDSSPRRGSTSFELASCQTPEEYLSSRSRNGRGTGCPGRGLPAMRVWYPVEFPVEVPCGRRSSPLGGSLSFLQDLPLCTAVPMQLTARSAVGVHPIYLWVVRFPASCGLIARPSSIALSEGLGAVQRPAVIHPLVDLHRPACWASSGSRWAGCAPSGASKRPNEPVRLRCRSSRCRA